MEEIQKQLQNVIKELFDVKLAPEVTEAPGNIEADWSSNVAMQLAGQLHQNPTKIAGQIAEKMPGQTEVLSPGFLNFISPDEYFVGKMAEMSADFAKSISCSEYSGQTAVYEFSDPNPFKMLHVGHFYTSIVGDSLASLAEYAGAKVIRANFGGDFGLHVAKTLWVLRQKGLSDFSIQDIAGCYVEGEKAYNSDEQAQQEITELNKEIYKISTENLHDSELAQMYWHGREISYQYFEDFYAQIGVKFDKYYPESSVVKRGLTEVMKAFEAGVYEKSDGAIIFKGEPYNLHTRVFINREGVPTYETKDVGLLFTKWDDWHFDQSIVITGNEQKDYMAVVLKSVEQYAPKLVERSEHLTHGMVRLPGEQKISSREGNGPKAVDVLEMVRDKLQTEYNNSDMKIVLGAIKYAFLKYKMGGNIVFDLDESVSMTGNSGPYLQYSCVRARKILERTQHAKISTIEPNERALVKKVVQYRDVLNVAVSEKAPHKVCNYLYELAQEFSRFYENCPVAGDAREAERAQMVATFLKVMEHGLDLLGIEIPEEM